MGRRTFAGHDKQSTATADAIIVIRTLNKRNPISCSHEKLRIRQSTLTQKAGVVVVTGVRRQKTCRAAPAGRAQTWISRFRRLGPAGGPAPDQRHPRWNL